MKEGLNSGEISKYTPKVDIGNLSSLKVLATGLRTEELDPFVKKIALDYVQEENYKIDLREFNAKWAEESPLYNFRQRLYSYGLLGPLKNISLSEIKENDESKKISFLKKETRFEKKAYVVSADYYSNDEYKGKVFNIFYFNIVGVDWGKTVPSFKYLKYVQVPPCLAEKLSGPGRTLWISNKNSFEK